MDDKQNPNDVIINRINLQLARSRSILASWRTETQREDCPGDDELADNDDEFVSVDESAGIGSRRKDDAGSALPTRRSANKDRLLEQLIGKKAANAKRKEDAHKSMSASRHAAPKPVVAKKEGTKRVEESESEEEGRAAAFKSRRVGKPPEDVPPQSDDDMTRDEMDEAGGTTQSSRDERVMTATSEAKLPSNRKGGTSYLDELLAKKGKKKKKQK